VELRRVLVPAFAEPIVLADGAKLATLRDAIAHLGQAIPKSDHDMPAVLSAAEMLMKAAEQRGPAEFARSSASRSRTPPRPASDRVDLPKVKI
jgi:hypothetical protein